MCDIFPELDNCCFILSLRVAMLFIAVFSITTGAATLTAAEKIAGANAENLKNSINHPPTDMASFRDNLLSQLSVHILNTIFVMAVLFMFTGVILLCADLIDEEGLVQVFVWLEFLNVMLGFILLIAVAYECTTANTCLLDMDWLSIAFVLTAWFFFMTVWLYFISVANSYVLHGDSA